MISRAEAKEARDELAATLGIASAPCAEILGLGIAREEGSYVVEVDVTRPDVELPDAVRGVPVRAVVSALPRAY
ncbi:MAG: hypothetical protein ACLGIA_12945 [Actinomycetes bacterium]